MKKYYFTSGIRGIVGEHSGNIRGAKAQAQKLAEQLDEEITIFVRSNKEIDYSSINTGDGMWNIINDYCYYFDKVCPEATTERQKDEVIIMKTQVMNNRWNGIETVTVWFDDDMSTYEIIDNENGDTITMIYDGEYLDEDGQVDYDRLYNAIADKIGKYLSNTTEVEIEEYDEDDETPVNKRQYDVYYTDGQNETNTTLDAETAKEALKCEQWEIDSWNEEAGYTKWWITKVRYTV